MLELDICVHLSPSAVGLSATVRLCHLSGLAEVVATNRLILSWSGGGFALETTTNLGSVDVNHWLEVTGVTNPFTNAIAAPQQFFRSRK